jgi:anti-anti-sigma factor
LAAGVTGGEPVRNGTVDVATRPDGSLVVQPHGFLGADSAGELRRVLVHALRRVRPERLILDLADVSGLDPINLGTLAAVCELADEHQVAVYVENSSATVAGRLAAAGVPRQRLRRTPVVR